MLQSPEGHRKAGLIPFEYYLGLASMISPFPQFPSWPLCLSLIIPFLQRVLSFPVVSVNCAMGQVFPTAQKSTLEALRTIFSPQLTLLISWKVTSQLISLSFLLVKTFTPGPTMRGDLPPVSPEPTVPALGQGGLLTCLPFGASVWSPLPLQCLLPRALHVTVNLNMVTCLLMLCPSEERCHSWALSLSCCTG